VHHDPAEFAPLLRFAQRYRAGELPPAAYTAGYVLYWQRLRQGERLAQRLSRSDPTPDAGAWFVELDRLGGAASVTFLADLLERYNLRTVSRRVNLALVGWLRGSWPLSLCEQVPSTRDVLRMQIEGTRPVTVIAEHPRLLQPVEDKADAFAFVCHDLEHAWQFFHDRERHLAQRRFAAELECAIERGVFAPYVADPLFASKFDYLAAEMNTHVAHSLQYLRAILLEFLLRAEAKAPNDRLSDAARARLHQCLAVFSASAEFIPEAVL
jgi:hypothetical protein